MSEAAKKLDDTLLELGQLLEPQHKAIRYMAGTRIFESGAPGDFAYMIDSGYIEISTFTEGTKQIIAILGPGEIFGEMALLDGQPRSASATAMHEALVMPISREQLLNEIWQGSPITRLILIAAIDRLRTSFTKSQRSVDENHDRDLSASMEKMEVQTARSNASQQLRLRFEMERAIKNEEFTLAYQPIASLADGRIAGFEALVRWPQPGGGLHSPDQFIPLAEQSRLIVPLGAWILKTALRSLATIGSGSAIQQDAQSDFFMSVNVSPRQLEREEDVEHLVSIIEHSTVNPANIKIEITEQALLLDPRMATIALARLKSTGVLIAIDDFGTGYSSLSYLHRFPLDTLKIDRSFIDGVVNDKNRQRVVSAIIGLAHDLGMDVVAEGVEERDDVRWLHAQSCRYIQGFYISKPVSFFDALGYLQRDIEF